VRPEQQRRGYAIEIAEAGIAAAHCTTYGRPVTAYLLEHIAASKATVERIGCTYADRDHDEVTLQRLVEHV
jgi:hypothetical protein